MAVPSSQAALPQPPSNASSSGGPSLTIIPTTEAVPRHGASLFCMTSLQLLYYRIGKVVSGSYAYQSYPKISVLCVTVSDALLW